MSGVTSPYEVPTAAELVVDTGATSEEASVAAVLQLAAQLAPRGAGGAS
jgi:adenylylsulfate kinase-like enzyme